MEIEQTNVILQDDAVAEKRVALAVG